MVLESNDTKEKQTNLWIDPKHPKIHHNNAKVCEHKKKCCLLYDRTSLAARDFGCLWKI